MPPRVPRASVTLALLALSRFTKSSACLTMLQILDSLTDSRNAPNLPVDKMRRQTSRADRPMNGISASLDESTGSTSSPSSGNLNHLLHTKKDRMKFSIHRTFLLPSSAGLTSYLETIADKLGDLEEPIPIIGVRSIWNGKSLCYTATGSGRRGRVRDWQIGTRLFWIDGRPGCMGDVVRRKKKLCMPNCNLTCGCLSGFCKRFGKVIDSLCHLLSFHSNH